MIDTSLASKAFIQNTIVIVSVEGTDIGSIINKQIGPAIPLTVAYAANNRVTIAPDEAYKVLDVSVKVCSQNLGVSYDLSTVESTQATARVGLQGTTLNADHLNFDEDLPSIFDSPSILIIDLTIQTYEPNIV